MPEAAARARLPGLGPVSCRWLQQAGITTPEQLQALGAVAAYVRVRQLQPRVSLNLLWALEGAITGQPWQTVARQERTRLLLALDALEQASNNMSSTNTLLSANTHHPQG